MKFKAVFTDRGAATLSKAFLPTLEKFGKTCQVLVGPEEVHFVQTAVNTDGPHVAVRFAVDVLFEPETFKVQSRHFNLIAFSLELALLLKVLRSAGANAADSLEARLTQKPVVVPGEAEPQSKPFLSFACRGSHLSLVQDLPISRPFGPSEIDRLVDAKDVASLCDHYVDLQPALIRLQSVADRMKSLGSVIKFAVCKNGDVHLEVVANHVLLGTQLQKLNVFPQNIVSDPNLVDRTRTPEEQLQAAISGSEAQEVYMQLKHLTKVINVTQLSQPAQVLTGIGEAGGHVHVMYVYRDPSNSDSAYDDSIGLSFKLPVREESD